MNAAANREKRYSSSLSEIPLLADEEGRKKTTEKMERAINTVVTGARRP